IEDTDLGGVVYHANYIRFLERARSDLLRCLDINQRESIEGGQGVYAVVDLQITYARPARFDDDLLIHTTLDQIGAATAVFHQTILRGGERIAEARITVAFVAPNGRPRRHPPEWIQRMKTRWSGCVCQRNQS